MLLKNGTLVLDLVEIIVVLVRMDDEVLDENKYKILKKKLLFN